MSLTTCLKRAGSAINTEDKAAILKAAAAYRKGGMSAADAGRKAVDERIVAVQGMLSEREQAVADGTADQPAQATHADPGEAPEAATQAVVTEAIKTAADNRDRKPSEMRAELLAMVDEAIKEAPDYMDFQEAVKTFGEKDAIAVFTSEAKRGAMGEKFAPKGYSRPTRTFKIPGDGTFTVQNTVRQLLKFRAQAASSPGFRDKLPAGGLNERATDTLDRRNTDAAIANMLDEGDFQAAVDFAEFKGVKLEDVKLTKVLRERLEKWQKDQESAKRMAEWKQAQDEGKPAPGSLASMMAEKANEQPEEGAKADDGIASQTFEQWARASYAANEYRGAYLEAFDGNEDRAVLASIAGTTDKDRKTSELLKAAKQKYHSTLFDLPREASISLDVWDALDNAAKVEAQRHFYDLDSRITRRDQDNARAKVKAENEKKAPYEAAFSEVDAEIRRLDALPGPVTKRQNELSARRERLREALWQIGQGKEPDGRLLKASPPAAPAQQAQEGDGGEPAELAPMPAVAGIPREVAQNAHRGTSFVPEERAGQEQQSFMAALQDAWAKAARIAGQDEKARERITEVFTDVAQGYRARYMRTLEARSRVMSSMIAGPARFPVERNRKRMETERRRSEEAEQYLARGIKRLIRAARGPIDNSPESELESIRLRLAEREETQETMKAANAALRKGDDAALEDLGFTAEQIAELKKGDFAGRKGFADYRLTNNNAEIRRLRGRLEEAEARLAAAQAGPTETERAGVRIVEDAQDDRLRLIFDGKPSDEVREDLKANGFKWSPKNSAWQRALTGNARYAAKRVLDKHFPADDAPMFARKMRPEQRAANFDAWAAGAEVVDRDAAVTRGFKTGEAVAVEAYHGTARPDRVGTVFNPKRATSGPMAFFTSDPNLASSYAEGKEDTSIGEDYDGDYSQWFKVKTPGQRALDIASSWWYLTPEQREKINDLAPRVVSREDDDGNYIIELAGEGHTNGVGNYEYEYRKSRNPLRALVENWLASGMLFNEERDFLKVLEASGFPMGQVEFDSPRAKHPFVYKTLIRMGNPLVTSDIPQRTMDALEQAAKRDRSRPQAGGVDSWDKNTRTVREWVAQLQDADRSTYAWTSIPDKVTDVLKAQGYDGIIDWSGKGGGDIVAPVYIPFAPTQIKSAIGNKGTFDADKKDILMRRGPEAEAKLTNVQQDVDTITATWANPPEVRVVWDLQDSAVDERIRAEDARQRRGGATGTPLAVYDRGTVYIVASAAQSDMDVARSLFHEGLGHAGLRAAFGDSLKPMLAQMVKTNRAAVEAKAREYGLDMGKESDALRAAEEVLAELAETRPTSTWVKRAISAIRQWLRDNLPGIFGDMELSDADIVARFIVPARNAIVRGGEAKPGGSVTVFSRADADQQDPFWQKIQRGESFTEQEELDALSISKRRLRRSGRVVERGTFRPGAGEASIRWDAAPGRDAGFTNRGAWLGQSTFAVAVEPEGVTGSRDDLTDSAGGLPLFRRGGAEAIREVMPQAVQDRFNDAFTSQRGFNRWWHRTVGTQLHKAKVNKEFGRVYYAVQDFMKDVSRIATRAADQAPDLLPQIETLKDIAKAPPKKADMQAASAALFDGTLRYKRDGEGAAVLADEDELGGIVWTDDELRSRGVSEAGIQLYRQARAAIDTSLDNMLAADIYRMVSASDMRALAGNQMEAEALLARVRKAAASDDPRSAVRMVRQALQERIDLFDAQLEANDIGEQAETVKRLRDKVADALQAIEDKEDRINSLQDAGYAPLMRFGQYTVDVLNDEGKRVFFGMYESQMAANMAARKFREQGLTVTQGVQSKREFELLKGLSPETAKLFAELLGVEQNEAMQEWLKNAVAEQSALKRHIRRKGIEGFDDDASRVVAAFLTSNARAASRALHSQRVQDAVASVTQGDVKDEAIALADYVNNPVEEAQAIRSLLFVQYIGGSVASAAVNLTQTFVQTFPFLAQYGGMGKAGKRIAAAMKDALGKIEEPDLAAAIKRAEEDGVIKPQEVFQLQAEASRTMGSNIYVRKGLAAWGALFQLAEQYNRRVAFIASYRTAKEQVIADPFAFAENAVDETQSVFNKGNRPNWSRGGVGATLFTFKTFMIQYMEFLSRLPMEQRLLALAVLVMLSGARGLPFGEDAEDIVDTIAQQMGYNWTTKDNVNRWLVRELGQGWADFIQHGFSGISGVPLDVSQRLGMADLLPATGVLKPSETRKEDQVLETFGVAGSAVRDVLRGEMRPLAIRNVAKAVDMYDMGMYRDTRGRKITETDAVDAILKGIGFQPSNVAREQRAVGREYEKTALYRKVKNDITERMALGRFEGDKEKIAEAREARDRWNEQNPDAKIEIDGNAVLRRVAEMRKSRRERFVASAPKDIRKQTAEALQ